MTKCGEQQKTKNKHPYNPNTDMRMKHLWKILPVFLLAICGCDDNTGTLGAGMMPDEDNITVKTNTLEVTTRSLLVDSVYARTSTAYIGKYTDPDFGVFEADFLTQFNCTDNLVINEAPDSLVISNYASLNLFYEKNDFYGDSLNVHQIKVYELNRDLETDDKEYCYTSIDPQDFYNEEDLLASKFYSIRNMAINDSTWNEQDQPSVNVMLPESFFNKIITLNKEHPEYFENSETFIDNVFKGIYVKHESGEGSVLYLSAISLNLISVQYMTDENGWIQRDENDQPRTDSVSVATLASFTSTREVIQANRFQNSERLKQLAEETGHTYLKTPAGIFTEATLPIDDITAGEYANDTINSVQLSFTAYNQTGSNNNTAFQMPKPEQILLLRKKDMYTFFEKSELTDNITSYTTTLQNNNEYKFDNINNLVNACIQDRENGEKEDSDWTEKNPDWNKIVLIPVNITTTTSSSTTTIVNIEHDLRLTSAKLVGGPDGEALKLYVAYTTFN